MAQGRRIYMRCFLEGIEVDVISVTVQGTLGQAAQASIQMPPGDSAHELLPRTLAHVFWCETKYEALMDTSSAVSVSYAHAQQDLSQWKLLFAGEAVAYSFRNVGGHRSLVLQCQDFSSYFTAAQLYWGTGSNSTTSYRRNIFAGASKITAGKQKVQGSSALVNLLRARPTTLPTLPGLLGGIVALLEASTGVYDSASGKNHRGINDFLSQAELRLHLSRMLGAHPEDDTSAVFIDSGDFRAYVSRLTAAMQSTASLMDLIQMLLGKIYHQWCSLLAPPFLPEATDMRYERTVPSGHKFAGNKDLRELYVLSGKVLTVVDKRIEDTYKRASQQYAEQLLSGNEIADPARTTRIKGVDQLDTTEHLNFAADVTKAGGGKLIENPGKSGQDYSEPTTQSTDTGMGYARWVGQNIREQANVVKGPGPAPTNLRNKASALAAGCAQIATGVGMVHNITASGVSQSDVFNSGKQTVYDAHTTANLRDAKRALTAGRDAIAKGLQAPVKLVSGTGKAASRLNQFLIMPDLFMAPPPRCNVLFPDQYVSLTYGRNWLAETTRLWMFGRTTTGADKKDMYFSPNSSILGGTSGKDATDAVKKGISFLMRHEKFTGPVPALEGIGDNGVFKKIHTKSTKDNKKDNPGNPQEAAGQALLSPMEHMQRAANYTFLSKRYETRTVTIEARYSPQIVVGLPMLVLDPQPGTHSRVDDPSAPLPRGTHFLGVVESLTHQLSSGAAGTTIVLSKCRTHIEGVDLFAPQDDQGIAEQTKTRWVTHSKKRYIDRVPETSKHDGGLVEGQFQGTSHEDEFKDIDFMPAATYLKSFAVLSTNKFDTKVITGGNTFYAMADGRRVRMTEATVGKKKVRVRLEEIDLDGSEKLVTVFGKQDVSITEGNRLRGPRQIDGSHSLGSSAVGSDAAVEAGLKSAQRMNQTHPYRPEVEGWSLGVLGANATTPGSKPGTGTTVVKSVGAYIGYEVTVEEFTTKPVKNRIHFSFEQSATPPWFANIYLPGSIGFRYYQPMLGCDSILDQAAIPTDQPAGVTAWRKGEPQPFTTVQMDDGAGGHKDVQVPSSLLDAPLTIKEAADNLAEAWLALKEDASNVALFVDVYTQRSHASLLDIMGNQNPHLLHAHSDKPWLPGDVAVPGFHGNAFGDLAGLTGYDGKPLSHEALTPKLTAKLQPTLRKVSGDVDPRAERYARVLAYVAEVRRTSPRTNSPIPDTGSENV